MIGKHSFRATGITEYLRNGGKLEIAQQMANHESARTTALYDRRTDQVSLDEVERIVIWGKTRSERPRSGGLRERRLQLVQVIGGTLGMGSATQAKKELAGRTVIPYISRR